MFLSSRFSRAIAMGAALFIEAVFLWMLVQWPDQRFVFAKEDLLRLVVVAQATGAALIVMIWLVFKNTGLGSNNR